MKLSVAFVGGGSIAGSHLTAAEKMPELLQIAAVADLLEERAQLLAEKYQAKPYTDYREMIIKEKPDLVVITLPNALHKEAAIFSAEQGCHVMLEKPMALTAAECDEIIAAVDKNKVKLMVGHTQHYFVDNRKAKQLIESEVLGKLVMINDMRHRYYYNATRPQWFYSKAMAGGGLMMNLGSHSVDKIQWLSGSRIHKIRAVLSHEGPIGDIEASGLVFLENEHGLPATIAQSGYPGTPRNETELIFTKGMLKLASGEGLWMSTGTDYEPVALDKQEDPFVLQFFDLLKFINEDIEPECSMAYSRSIVAVINMLYRSHELKQELIVE